MTLPQVKKKCIRSPPPPLSPKRNKKLKMERETSKTRDRTRSKTRHRTPQRIKHARPLEHPYTPMSYTYKLVTLNINGIASNTLIRMLEDFLWRQDVDFALLQEVKHKTIDTIQYYTAYVNAGTNNRGTAILAKKGLPITNIKRIPSGRGIAGTFNGLWVVKVFAPSGAEKRKEREDFFNVDVPLLMPPNDTEMILAGYFDCVLAHEDCTGQRNYNRTLERMVHGLGIIGVGVAPPTRTIYTLHKYRCVQNR